MTRNKKKDPLDIYEAVWIGLRRVKETMFMWIDESPLNYKNWAKGEPNNLGGKENCVAIYSKGINCTLENDHLKRWIDIPCDYKLYGGFVCKKRRRKH
ncbi:hypothetical protein GCK32_008630 [Trichostrongylus colubriformis]|uniref:C-type lectin domain-containing protein n=1 Tax=Trichostrongylus colubriformis TaxID=6319 RepID=A0AAN8J3N5_TRICO